MAKKSAAALPPEDLEERAALIADGCGVSQVRALEMAKQQQRDEQRRALGNRGWEQKGLL
jgi:hypothetical protein